MVKIKYKSLVTKETIDYYLSIIKDEDEKKDFLSTVSKFDIRIATEPVIEEDEEFYYKIWIWRRGTKKRAHIKLYNKLELLKKEETEESKTTIILLVPSLAQILWWISFYANVQDYEEYCEKSYRDPSDETSRTAHPRRLKRAEGFKKFITNEEIGAIPFLPTDKEEDEKIDDEFDDEDDDDEFYDLDDQEDFTIPFDTNSIFLKDKREYDKLKELRDIEQYYSKIVKSYLLELMSVLKK